MPQTVTIDLPLVITGHGGVSLVRPIGFCEYVLASSTSDKAIRAIKRRVVKACRQFVGTALIARMIRGPVVRQRVHVEIAPPRKMSSWRQPMEIHFDTFVWSQDDALTVTYVPTIDLTVVASPGTDVNKLVNEQIRSAIRRMSSWTLQGLAELDHYETSELAIDRVQIEMPTPQELARQSTEEPTSKTPTLKAVATRLKRNSLRPAYHREQEVELLSQLLAVDQARSVLLVGPDGVGKTAIFHQWVRTRDRYNMKHVQCWATDGSRLISGQTGFGMWQKQVLAMADESAKYPSVVHLGNLVELSESGRLRGSGGCGALLAPRLADGSMISVLECTPEQLTRMQRTEPRLVSALTTLVIEEPAAEQTRSILLEAASAWRPVDVGRDLKRKRKKKSRPKKRGKQKRQAIRQAKKETRELPVVQPEALQVLDRLHRRFQTDAAAPGRPLAFFHAVMSEMGHGETLTQAKVIEAFGRQTGLPRFLVDDQVRPDLESIHQQLAAQVLGQDGVIKTLVDLIATLAADLSRGDRPLASLMLIGPTGVGKTETAKSLARLIYSDVSRLVRIDMSELSSPSAVGRLIGDAVNPEGLLTSAVRAQPFSLVLLDEFEKAHSSVFDLLLQVLGEGRLTDGRGRIADFRNSIVMMTSNLGVDSFRAMPLGLADTQQRDRYRNHFEKQVRD
ncbi:MAG: AAA domain-containing protein, partial [Pirellulaceae bacterium]|nr:AAA domain-containing protein [Pirellulaceae bacterium]